MEESKYSLIKIEGKVLEKLIDTVSAGIGTIYNPYRIRREARAEADRTVVLAEANAQVALIEDQANAELARRASQRLAYQEMQKQKNIESIADQTMNHLGSSVSDVPVDEGWNLNFFSKAQNVTNSELQVIWSKVLAAEITEPNSVGSRTLDVLQGLSTAEAQLFERASKGIIANMIPEIGSDIALSTRNLIFHDILKLQDAGLVSSIQLTLPLFMLVPANIMVGNQLVSFDKFISDYNIVGYRLTAAGENLYKAPNFQTDPTYPYFVEEYLVTAGHATRKS